MAGDPFSSHPYPSMKEVKPINHYCEVCDKGMKMKDKAAHERSKKHAKSIKGGESLVDVVGVAFSSDAPRKDTRECHHCHEVGHAKSNCPSLPREVCFNCQEPGHRKTECPNPTVVICRNCTKPGHFSKECPEPLSLANIKCRNCEQLGHKSRDCPEPKDWSEVQCLKCGEKGHTAVRCQAETMEADMSGWDNDNADVQDGGQGTAAADDDAWMNPKATDTAGSRFDTPAPDPNDFEGGDSSMTEW